MASEDREEDTKQKTFYPEVKTAEWIEDTSDKSERSESYVASKILEQIAESIDLESIDIHQYDFKAEERE